MKKIISKWKILAPVVMVLAFLLILVPAALANDAPMKLRVVDVVNDNTPVAGSRVESYLPGWKTIGTTDVNGEVSWTWSGSNQFRFYPPGSEAGKYAEKSITFTAGESVQINLNKITFHVYDAVNKNNVKGSEVKSYPPWDSEGYTDETGNFDYWLPNGNHLFRFYPPSPDAGRYFEKTFTVNASLANPVQVRLSKITFHLYDAANKNDVVGSEVKSYPPWDSEGYTDATGNFDYWLPNGDHLFRFYPPSPDAGRYLQKTFTVNASLANPVEVRLNKIAFHVKDTKGKALAGVEVEEYYNGWKTVGTTGASGTIYYWLPNGTQYFRVGSGSIWFQSGNYTFPSQNSVTATIGCTFK